MKGEVFLGWKDCLVWCSRENELEGQVIHEIEVRTILWSVCLR